MVNKKLFKLLSTLIVTFSVLLTSCNSSQGSNSGNSSNNGGEGSSNTSHEHTFDSKWEYNDAYHWHPSTCGHDVKSGEEKHTFISKVTNPTYENGGFTTYTCSQCGYSYIDDETDKLEHNYSNEWSFDENSHWHTCIDEGFEELKKDTASHSFTSTVTNPTFEEEGYTTFTCSVCGYSYTDNKINKLEHNYSNELSFDENSHWYACIDSGYENLKKDENSHIFTSVDTDPTYENGGYTTYTCSECGYSYVGNQTNPLPITITWQNYDGSVLEIDENVTYGSMPTYDGTTPIKEKDDMYEYSFTGWSPEIKAAIEDTTYVARFTSENRTYKIDFDLNGGNSTSYEGPIEIKTLNKDAFFFDCVKDEWQFRGREYNGDKIFDERGNQLKNINLIENMVFKAVYSQTAKLTIAMNLPEAGTVTGDGEFAYNSYVDLTANSNKDYKFVGWFYQDKFLSSEETFKYMLWDKDVTLEARFEKISYDLTIYSSNEECGLVILKSDNLPNYVPWYNERTAYNSEVTIRAYSKSNIKFLGWYDENNQLVSKDITYSFVMPDHDYKLEAKWDFFSINYILNGGINNPNNPNDYSTDDEMVDLLSPTKDGYSFLGWRYNGEIIDSIYTDKLEDVVLEAVWSSYQYEILEDSNGKYASIVSYDQSVNEIFIPETIEVDGEEIVVKEIGTLAFANNYYLTSLEIPENVTKIGSSAFADCQNLESIEFGKNSNLEEIGDYAFTRCSHLKSITIPDSVKSIGMEAFSTCEVLENVIIGGNSQLTEIKDYAFTNCSSLISIYIPNSVTTMGSMVFNEYSDTNIYCAAFSKPDGWDSNWNSSKPVVWGSYLGVYGSSNELEYAVCLDEGKNKYINLIHYSGISAEVIIPEFINVDGEDIPIKNISDKAFYGNKMVNSVTIPNSVTQIGESAFVDCSYLETINIEENSQLAKICSNAFKNCYSLTSIYLPLSVTIIESNAFYNCSDITIYCAASTEPEGRQSNWNNYRPVVLNSYRGIHGNLNGLEYLAFNGEEETPYITITGYDGLDNEVNIPETIKVNDADITVKSISDRAFYENSTISSVFIPSSVTTIGESAFYNCTNLSSITIGENSNLVEIGEAAFSNCSSLISFSVPDSVIEINNRAFYYCFNLKTVNIGFDSNLNKIGDRAFDSCGNLESIFIPLTVTEMGTWVFSSCSKIKICCEATSKPDGWGSDWDSSEIVWNSYGGIVGSLNGLEYIAYKDEEGEPYIVITGYTGSNAEVVIPEKVSANGKEIPVRIIKDKAFFENEILVSVTIPDSVVTIGNEAFMGCINLENVTLSENSKLSNIGEYAFSYCTSLTSINIPNCVTTIGRCAFIRSTALKSVVISENSQLEEVGDHLFEGCSSLTSINIPNKLTIIPEGMFSGCSSLVSINIEENSELNEIGDSAFYNCSSLISINIPDNVTKIGTQAFESCSNLESVILGENSTLMEIGDSAFNKCASLTHIYVPNTVKVIGNSTFDGCPKLTIYCALPTKLSGWHENWNSSATVIWNSYLGIFGDINGFEYVACVDEEGNKYIVITGYTGSNTEVIIPEFVDIKGEDVPVKIINDYAFSGNDIIESISIPSSVTRIGTEAFQNCTSLASVIIGENSELREIDTSAFYYCISLTMIALPDNLIEIDSHAFIYCRSLTTVLIGENSKLEKIGNSAFEKCSSLTLINIPDSVIQIGASAFAECSNLAFVDIKDSSKLAEIGDSAFSSCISLTSINIPDSVIQIGANAFYSCSNLALVDIKDSSKLAEIGDYAFNGCSLLTSINIPDSVTKIGAQAFRSCSNLESVVIGKNSKLAEIGDAVFYNCSKLTSINIPDSVIQIGANAFYSCSNLALVDIKDSSKLAEIGESAFYGCWSLTSINIPDSLVKIGSKAFANCTNLESVVIGENSQLAEIGIYAFENCSSLTSIYISSNVTKFGGFVFKGCSNLVIYCEISSAPDSWDPFWNSENRSVNWGITYKEYLSAISQ